MNALRLFHISEEPGISQFVPRPSKSSHHQVKEEVVWAVAEWGLYNYYVPRNCPRVSFYAQEETRAEDVERFLEGVQTRKVLAVEAGWFDRIASTPLTRYEFDPSQFVLFNACAGYYLSQRTETPIAVQRIADPLRLLLEAGIEVRLVPSLWELRERILKSSLGFSFIRMNHAAPPAQGYTAFHPV